MKAATLRELEQITSKPAAVPPPLFAHAARKVIPKKVWKSAIDELLKLATEGYHEDADTLAKALIERGCDLPKLHYYHAAVLRTLKQFKEAETSIKKVIEKVPPHAKYFTLLGDIQLEMGNFDDAAQAFIKVTEMVPNNHLAWLNAGLAFFRARAYGIALSSMEQASRVKPKDATTWLHLSDAYLELRDIQKAYEALDKAVKFEHGYGPACVVKRLKIANTFKDVSEYEKIVTELQSENGIYKVEPGLLRSAELELLQLQGRAQEAIELAKSSTGEELATYRLNILGILSNLYQELDDTEGAMQTLRECCELAPENPVPKWNLALLEVGVGDLSNGYENYEYRWQVPGFPSSVRKFAQPQWNGQPLEGKSILVWAEQGVGDQVRWASMVADLEACGGKVTIEVAEKLVPLVAWSYPWATVKTCGPVYCVDRPEYLGFDYQVPVFSLAKVLRPTLADYYAKQKCWIPRQTDLEDMFRKVIGVEEGEVLIGICWRSSLQTLQRSIHYLEPIDLFPLTDLPNTKFVCLQYDRCEEEVEAIRKIGVPLFHFANLDQKDDLANTAGLIGACDIVISVGTAVAELSGAIGVPTVLVKWPGGLTTMGTDHIPWNPSTMILPMNKENRPYVIAEFVKYYPEILAWAERATSSTR